MADWYKRDPRAFVDGVHGLGAAAIGAYAVILDLIYMRGGPIVNDARWIGSILGCPTKTAQTLIRQLLDAGKLALTDGRLSNERALTTIRERADSNLTRQKSGALGGRQKALNASSTNETNDLGLALASPRIDKSRVDKTLSKDNAAATPPCDPEKAMWDASVAYLTSAGIADAKARTLIGKWLKLHQRETVAMAIGAAQRSLAVEPVSFIEAALKARGQQQGQTARDRAPLL